MFFKIVVGLLILLCLIGNTYIISSVLLNKNLRNWIGYHVLSIVIVDFVTEAFFKSSAVLMLMQQNTFGDYLCYPIYIALRSSQTIILLNLLIVLFWINVACYEKMRVLNITSNSRTILTIVALWIGTITYVTYEKLKPHSELNLKSCRDDNKLLFTYVVNIAIALILIAFYVSLISLKIFRKASRTVRSQAIYSNISMELLPISDEDECNDKRMRLNIYNS
ncbi:CLUMA_CG001377, isoform A [Clunio marinus]|uniref:CLUMA_CG001377, isoform A n=1 Tax=Clunio marinus TaxID=568069 RepID=A0A1J1HJJ2_9DIPT|nr:CLUMA_CG001377, isoform A [Clunio marinus]